MFELIWVCLCCMLVVACMLMALWPWRSHELYKRVKNGTRLERAWAAYELLFVWSWFFPAEHRRIVKSWTVPMMLKAARSR